MMMTKFSMKVEQKVKAKINQPKLKNSARVHLRQVVKDLDEKLIAEKHD